MGPENRFIHRVNGRIPKSIHREKMHNAYRGGTPDVYYSGMKADLWVEYKWQTMPKSGLLVPELSPLQKDWLGKRYTEGRKVAVCAGTTKGAVWMTRPYEWLDGMPSPYLFDDKEMAEVITAVCS